MSTGGACLGILRWTCPESRSCWRHYRKDQSLIDVELTVRDLSYGEMRARLVVIHDLTERRRHESEAFQAGYLRYLGVAAFL